MCSDHKYLFVIILLCAVACSPYRKLERIRSGEVAFMLSVPEDGQLEEDNASDVKIDSIRSSLSDEPIIMNAIRDSESGEMVATDIINASKVVARFRNVAERAGYVSVSFDVMVPAEMSDSYWQLKIYPMMRIQDDTVSLDPVFITGEGYRAGQLRGYERYRDFLSRIITDSTELIWRKQLEVFLERHFPETYAMKSDSSVVSDPVAENLFGVSQEDALRHYTWQLKTRLNEKRKSRKDAMFERYVKDPIVSEGIRLDTVLTSCEGIFVYRYRHTFRSRPGLRKVMISMEGELFEDGKSIHRLPFPEELTFYISSLSSMADMTQKYRMMVLERAVYDNTKAFIDFGKGSSAVDTLLSDNASELKRVIRCIEDVDGRKEYVLDSLVIVASCSPEGTYAHNARLSLERSESIKEYISSFVPVEWKDSLKTSCVPENWSQLTRLVRNDTVLSEVSREKILSLAEHEEDKDEAELKLSAMPEYRYLREKIYPKLRTVSFDFHLHRAGMQKDTVHTSELDTVYMTGVKALVELDYKTAVSILRPYDDYNAALAFMSADYNHSALDVLNRLEDTDPRVCYLKAMVLARLGQIDEAMKYFELSIAYEPYLEHRANLDPEMFQLVRKRQIILNENSYE